ncbi:MAG TPA: HAMP domain-containing sensor histidine kinase [Candidatus Dormibacteraeota bacterium]|nr:HAMP domain-containing sensor histidine kinase [Candidatus Dormibacteraeota bacterium]
MSDLLLVLQVAVQAAFVLLAVATLADWFRHRDGRRSYLALAFGSLATIIVFSPAFTTGGTLGRVLTDTGLVLFLLSGYALLMFRDSFIPLGRVTQRAITIAIVVVAALGVAAGLPADPKQPHGPFQSLALTAVLVTWSLCVLEPSFRFWQASRRRPAVESARLRALTVGYAALVVEVLVGGLPGELTRNDSLVVLMDVVRVAIVPLLYISFSPPTWLRRVWRQPEEDAFRNALHDLLLYSPDRATLAQRALGWVTRLVGGVGALIVDSDGTILAARDLTVDQAAEVTATRNAPPPRGGPRRQLREPRLLVIPLHLQQGEGAMIILAGRFTPLFGDEEELRLRQYASSIAAGLDRELLTQRIASLEKAKTEFLNVASHELRGPMTVIKGYLTMLESGSLGDLSPRSMAVLPLLIAKSDEVDWMVEQMVEASRLEDGRLELKKQPADVAELTQRAIDGMRSLLTNHEVRFDMPSRAIHAEVDHRFQIVVRNLLSNAAKYSPARGCITVRVSQNGGARVAVTDEGIGIADENQARLFTRFVRIENQSTQHISGTGLGLWLSREIARMHDGDLTVESMPGRGSTFTLQLPLNQ